MTTTDLWNINALWRKTGVDRRTIEKLFKAQNIVPISDEIGYGPDALEAVEKWKATKEKDYVDGESPFKRLARLKGDEVERENKIAEEVMAGTLVEISKVERMVMVFVSKLELIPVKMESEFGLAQNIIARLTELLDEARRDMAKSVKRR